MMMSTSGIQNLIREGRFNQIYSQIQLGKGEGMHTMNDSLFRLYEQGKIEKEIMFARSLNLQGLRAMLKRGKV